MIYSLTFGGLAMGTRRPSENLGKTHRFPFLETTGSMTSRKRKYL